jgi:hypothetical protein
MNKKISKTVVFLLGIVLMYSCSEYKASIELDKIFSNYYEHKMISSGDNFPDFNARNDSLDLFLVALHERLDIKSFQKKVAWSDKELQENVMFLKSKNWLKNDIEYTPTVFITSNDEGEGLFDYSLPIAIKIANAIEREIPVIKKMFKKTDLSDNYTFESWAFFILSDVLLDNWQINNVEREFLQAEIRPERHRKNYYYGIMENVQYPKEQFGIYGNQYTSINDSLSLNIYGNNRNVVSRKINKDKIFRDSIISNAPKIKNKDSRVFEQMANHFKPVLLHILSNDADYINQIYKISGYSNEISFEEFFIWWYHFIYTKATDILAENRVLSIPKEGNFYSLIVR